MSKNRKNQSAAIRFGPALKASFLCLLIGGSAVGYVWQKNEIYRLGQQIRQRETRLAQLTRDDQRQSDQLAILHSPVMLDQRARELKLGLGPAQPSQIVRLGEAVDVAENKDPSRQLAARPAETLAP
jgi:hypothetical protein